jgi:hypothetical protein
MAYEYLLSALPALPERPGEKVDLDPREFAARLKEEGGVAWALGSEILMFMDIKALERIFVGAEPGQTALFDAESLVSRTGLPYWLERALSTISKDVEGFAFNEIWFEHFTRFTKISQVANCDFIENWVPWDIGLRRALATSRAKAMGVEVVASRTKELLGRPEDEYKSIVESVVSAREHADGNWRVADGLVAEYRMKEVERLAPIYTFNLDELMGYAARFVTLKECEYLKQ